MIRHIDLGDDTISRQNATRRLIQRGVIQIGGYRPGKIYGTLSCVSGKKMKVENRVFFHNEAEAINAGYRPCAHCLPERYRKWKLGTLYNFHPFLIVFIAVFNRRQAGDLFKDGPESFDVGVANIIHDLVHIFAAVL